MITYDDPERRIQPAKAAAEIFGYAMNLAEECKRCPMDDIVTTLVHADIDGEGLSTEEFGFFVILLAVADNETTRHAITHGMMAFPDHPEQWELFKAERPTTAADETVRWATPVVALRAADAVGEGAGRVIGDQHSVTGYSVRVEHPAVTLPVADDDHGARTAAVDAESLHSAPLLLAGRQAMRPVHFWQLRHYDLSSVVVVPAGRPATCGKAGEPDRLVYLTVC